MAIEWTTSQHARVSTLLAQYPIGSGRCDDLARGILPVALERDAFARMWRLLPTEGRYIVPRVALEAPWFFHVTTEAEAHYVDALTGVNGTRVAEYVDAHWTEGDAIEWIEENP